MVRWASTDRPPRGFDASRRSHPAQQILEDAGAPSRRGAWCPRPALAERAEELAEVDGLVTRLAEPRGPFRGAGARSGRGHALEGGVAVAIVERPLLGVGEDVVSLLNFLELLLGRLVARVDVGMVLPRHAAIGLLDRLWRGIAGDTENFVIVASGMTVENFPGFRRCIGPELANPMILS